MGTRRTTCTVCGDAPCYAFLSIQLSLFQSAYSSFLQGNLCMRPSCTAQASSVAAWWIQHVRRLAKHRPRYFGKRQIFVVYRGNVHKKPARSPVFYGVHPSGLVRCSPGVWPDSFASRLHEKRPLAGACCVVIIRSGSGDFFDGRFQQGDTLFDAVDFQIFFVAVEAGADRAKAVQRGDTVGRGDVGV